MLANDDALLLLKVAQDGLYAKDTTIRSLGLSKKRYYQRLRELIAAKLVVKENNVYKATSLGKIVFQTQVKILEEAIVNHHRLLAIEKLKQVPGLTNDEIEGVSKTLLAEGSYLAEYFLKSAPPEVYTSFEELIEKTVDISLRAKTELRLATRYVDKRVIEALATVAKRGVKVSVITDLAIILKRIQILKPSSNPKEFESLLYPLKGSGVSFRYAQIPFSFLLRDNYEAGVELADPVFTDNFVIGFLFQDSEVGKILSKRFDTIWQDATEDPVEVLAQVPTSRDDSRGGAQPQKHSFDKPV
ncbi:MAG: hypothetical protein M1503_12425 [Thaumarchaeota archaeon]|nr:hypothetical protein [Nitrososphaerota archaeon]MCL5319045.1 hypothetical protein [Nitrososphaerota archaeon]